MEYRFSSKKANQNTIQNYKFSKIEAIHTTCSANIKTKTTRSAEKLINIVLCFVLQSEG